MAGDSTPPVGSEVRRAFPRCACLETRPLKAGKAAEAVFVHQLVGVFGPFDAVEKITRKQNEIRISRQLLEHPEGRLTDALPRLLAMVEQEDRTHLFMEHISGVGERREPDRSVALTVVRALLRMSDDLGGLQVAPAPTIQARMVEALCGAPDEPGLAALRDAVPELCARYRALPQAICHDDVWWPNMAVRPEPKGLACRFIDFGRLSRNAVGADLQCFARMSLKDEGAGVMLEHLVHGFAAETGVPKRDIRFAGALHAAFRSLKRMQRLRKQGATREAEKERVTFANFVRAARDHASS